MGPEELSSEERAKLSTPFRLVLPAQIHARMIEQARVELPNECCGLLAGKWGQDPVRVEQMFPLVNALASPVEFESDPQKMFEACREIRKQGWEVLAVYHSHPTSPPTPSRKDQERNYSPEVMNLIISLEKPEVEMRAWWLTADGFAPGKWTLG